MGRFFTDPTPAQITDTGGAVAIAIKCLIESHPNIHRIARLTIDADRSVTAEDPSIATIAIDPVNAASEYHDHVYQSMTRAKKKIEAAGGSAAIGFGTPHRLTLNITVDPD